MKNTLHRKWLLAEAKEATEAAKWRAHVVAAAKAVQVSGQLLATGYDHDGLMLDLYGASDKDGIEVEDMALTGDTRSLLPAFDLTQMADMSHWCERQAERAWRAGAFDRALDRGEELANEARG